MTQIFSTPNLAAATWRCVPMAACFPATGRPPPPNPPRGLPPSARIVRHTSLSHRPSHCVVRRALTSSTRGDAINGVDSLDRQPDPSRMMSAYWHAAATLNYMRMQGYVGDCATARGDVSSGGVGSSIFTSHECLLLPLEAALTDPASRFNRVWRVISVTCCG
jgi:hypothetical protein